MLFLFVGNMLFQSSSKYKCPSLNAFKKKIQKYIYEKYALAITSVLSFVSLFDMEGLSRMNDEKE